jgi:CRISPR-associated endonuclease/helicase Cas3
MIPLTSDDFVEFFHAINNDEPFPWQRRLADQICEREWPAALALPTASGKTACLDIAVFALAVQANRLPEKRTAARRILFVVDRRVIVDQAYIRAQRLAKKLRAAEEGVLKRVADHLRQIAGDGDAVPLTYYQLRGGVFRDAGWVADPLQPAVLCSTVDQVGSRLLFRGYGVSSLSASIHAALLANDSLILLDEAHCSEPFRQTLEAVRRYRSEHWAENGQYIPTPFEFVEMSATPRGTKEPFGLLEEDRNNETLRARLEAKKPAQLLESKHKTASEGFVKDVVNAAVAMRDAGAFRVGVIVNRVATARLVNQKLAEFAAHRDKRPSSDVVLMIGRMRPLDRDRLLAEWEPKLRASSDRTNVERPFFVVATQCLEVGANFDFDALVTECSGLDALRQRFGRVLRLGRPKEDHRDLVATIVAPADGIKKDADDPIYGPALFNTWEWLCERAQGLQQGSDRKTQSVRWVDMGVDAVDGLLPADSDARCDMLAKLVATPPDAPVMLPAHVDCWVQTEPYPTPDPDVSLFLHGPQRGEPTVSVCWRADLGFERESDWVEAVAACPASSSECMPVPIGAFQRWMRWERARDEEVGDTEGEKMREDESREESDRPPRPVVCWRGAENSKVLTDSNEIRAGDVLVLPSASGGWNELGHVPESYPIDLGDRANLIARRKAVLRLCSPLVKTWPNVPASREVEAWLNAFVFEEADDDTWNRLKEHLGDLQEQLGDEQFADWAWLRMLADCFAKTKQIDRYCSSHPSGGVVMHLSKRLRPADLRRFGLSDAPEETDADDDNSLSLGRSKPMTLMDHTQHVVAWTQRFSNGAKISADLRKSIARAALLHDLGKLDPRWQAYLRGVARWTALTSHPLAKGAGIGLLPKERERRRKVAQLPKGFRHEFLSVQLAGCFNELLDSFDGELCDLILFLIGTHHGYGRPFAPVVEDEEPSDVEALDSQWYRKDVPLETLSWSGDERGAMIPPHRLDSGVPQRFWKCVRRYGWWGAAYLESLLRLADWTASRKEEGTDDEIDPASGIPLTAPVGTTP